MNNSISNAALIVLLVFLVACTQTKEVLFQDELAKVQPKDVALASDVSELSPEHVVREYYGALSKRDYAKMYALISDGFKKLEETANTFEAFEAYMSKFYDTAKGINILSAKESSNDGKKAEVDYTAEIILLNENKKELKSTFTMKKTENGWKLIHPYGDKIDTS